MPGSTKPPSHRNALIGAAESSASEPDLLDPLALMTMAGGEVAGLLSSALERVNALAHSGRIDRPGLRSLREELERAQRIGLIEQQLSRLVSGSVRVHEEALDLPAILREALAQRGREIETRGIEVHQALEPAIVVSDGALLFLLLDGLLDWCFESAPQRVELGVALHRRPMQAHLTCAFPTRCAAVTHAAGERAVAGAARGMSWQFVVCCAHSLGLGVELLDEDGRALLTLIFPRTAPSADALDTISDAQLDAPAQAARDSTPLAGSHVLVVSARRETRALVRDTVRPLGVMLDFVASVDEAIEFCGGGVPHALVYEAALAGGAMQRLIAELLVEAPSLACIQIVEQGKPFESITRGGREVSLVARSTLQQGLPAALLFELSRGR